MSEREYSRLQAQLKPFFTLLVVVASSLFLASCGGGSESPADPTATANSSDSSTAEGMAKALAVSGSTGTVPGGWKGRKPQQNSKVDGFSITPMSQFIKNSDGSLIAKGQLFLTKKSAASDASIRSWVLGQGWEIIGNHVSLGTYQINIAAEDLTALRAAKIKAETSNLFDSVLFNRRAGLDVVDSIDDIYSDPKMTDVSWAWNYNSIHLGQALSLLTSNDANNKIPVSVIDGGFRSDHSDITFSSINRPNGTPYTNGTVTCVAFPAIGYRCDFPDGPNHGMHVSGTISASSNQILGAGVAADKVSTHGWVAENDQDALQSIENSISRGIKIISISQHNRYCPEVINNTPNCRAYEEYSVEFSDYGVKLANILINSPEGTGALIIKSSGNYGSFPASTPNANYSKQPTELNGRESAAISDLTGNKLTIAQKNAISTRLILVGSYYLDGDGKRHVSSFTMLPLESSRAAEAFILAPGEYIYSLKYEGGEQSSDKLSGTSMAAPHVSGVAALIIRVIPNASVIEVRDIILSTADNQSGTAWKVGDGYRYLNAESAIKEAITRRNSSFIVDAREINGTTFVVPNGIARCQFDVSGTWGHGSSEPFPRKESSSGPRAIVVKRGANYHRMNTFFSFPNNLSLGNLQIDLVPGEKLEFSVDDGTNKLNYLDNEGSARIRWVCGPVDSLRGKYTKISGSGKILSDSANRGDGINDWQCTRDNEWLVLWEIKTDDGIRGRFNKYVNYTKTNELQKSEATNTGLIFSAPTELDLSAANNAATYVSYMNQAKFCGSASWNLPLIYGFNTTPREQFSSRWAWNTIVFPDFTGGPGVYYWVANETTGSSNSTYDPAYSGLVQVNADGNSSSLITRRRSVGRFIRLSSPW